jgi:autotransporter-associated beta strand protein
MNDSIVELSPQGSPLMNHPQKLPYPRLLRITCATIGVLLTLPGSDTASAQSTLTWIGGAANTANASGTANWLDATAPAGGSDYNFVFNPSDLVSPFRTLMSWNVADVGLLSLSLTGSGGTNFTWGGSSSIALKGGITVNSGDHTFNTTATVVNDVTWDIAASSSLTRSTANTFTLGADRKITKTGAGTLLLTGANSGIAGVLEVQQGMLRVGANAALGSGTVALNGGTLLIAANNTLTNTSASVSVLGDSTLIVNRGANLGSITHLMGDLSAGAGKLRVESGSLITGTSTAEVIFGSTTLTDNATFEVVNNGIGTTVTQLTLGAVGETGGARGLTKTGDGQLLLNANNTYSGATVVSAGSLIIGAGGSVGSSSVLDVASGATLDVSAVTGGFAVGGSQTLRGSGTIVGNTTVNGALQPGNSPGLLTFNNDLTLGGTAVTTMEITGTGVRGTAFDAIDVFGLLTYGGNLTLSLGTTFGVGSYSFDLFDFGSTEGSFDTVTLGGLYSGSLVNSSGVWGLANGNDTWTFTQSSGLLELEVVPEPSTYALLVLAAAGLGARVIRHRRRS